MSESFRLMTANLFRDRSDEHDFAAVLDRHRPDVVVVQELGSSAAEVLRSRYAYHDLRPSLRPAGRGIASSLSARFGIIPLPRREGGWARLEVADGPVHIAGIHLLNPVNFPWITAALGRRRQVETLAEWVDRTVGDGALVVVGDLNASPNWPAYRRLSQQWPDLVAAWAEATGTEPEPTWGWRPGWPKVLRIDHVLGRGLVAADVEVVPIRGTDHAAVIVDLAPAGVVPNPA